MKNMVMDDKLVKIADINGIEIFHLLTDKFKTNTINVFFQDELSKESATKNALIPAVLRRGTKKHTDIQQIALYLEELYGAAFDCGIAKKGERQIMHFYMEFIADAFTGDNSSLFEKSFNFIMDIVTNPIVNNSSFKEDFVSQEKENLKKLIESRVNDKMQYAVDKCLEIMCENEPFSIFEYGQISDLENINGKNLYDHYIKMLETYPMMIFVTGNINEKSLDIIKESASKIKRGELKRLPETKLDKEVDKVTDFTDKMNVSQGKLSLGFRTNISPKDPDYNQLVVFNAILGGGIHSKLFQNVRERASLAYYAFSRLEKFKGLMVISSGIEISNKEKAYKIILKQIEDIKASKISDYEYNSTIKTIETGIKSLKDSQLYMVDFYLSQLVTGTNDDFNSVIEKIKMVKKQDVVEIAKKVKLEVVYFLTSNGEAQEAEN